MRSEIVNELYDGLTDPATGIAAQMLTLPLDVDVERATGIMVVNGIKDEAVIKGEQFDRGVNMLALLTPDGPLTTRKGTANNEFSQGTLPLAVTIFHRGEVNAVAKVAQCEQVMRACVLAISAYFAQRQQDRIRNEVVVANCSTVTYGAIQDAGLGAVAAVVFSVDALDKRAQRTY